MLMKKSLREYLEEYGQGHTKMGTKLTHMVGIPMIVASLPLIPLAPPVGGGLFVLGWILQFIGHYAFEHNDPKFFGDPMNLLVGVVWAGLEWAQLVGIKVPLPGADLAA